MATKASANSAYPSHVGRKDKPMKILIERKDTQFNPELVKYPLKVLTADGRVVSQSCYLPHEWWIKDSPYDFVGYFVEAEKAYPITSSKPIAQPVSVYDIVRQQEAIIRERGAERDRDTERSMSSCVDGFNAIYNKDLTEEQGWAFMVLLKMARTRTGAFREDNYVDGANYFAFMGEAASHSVLFQPELNLGDSDA